MPAPTLLGRGWQEEFRRLGATRQLLVVCSPYVTADGCDFVRESLSTEFRSVGRLELLVDLSPINVLQESTNPEALGPLLDATPVGSLRHLPRLHAKVYIFDASFAIVTSANLTAGGLWRNNEYGLGTDDVAAVERIRDDIMEYAALGAPIERPDLTRYCDLARAVRDRFLAQSRTATRAAVTELQASMRAAEDHLIRLRVRGGRVTPLFAETIVYLLRRHGPLRTDELHPQIQELHPDLCDDSIDRVIDGVHFGKKWKHWVRSAQQRLRTEKRIVRADDGRWTLTTEGP